MNQTDGTYNYRTEVYAGAAEVRFSVVLSQNHPYRVNYTNKIWDEFFSRFTLSNPAAMSGRITTADGFSTRLVTVTLRNGANTINCTTRTNAKGFYNFADLPTGKTYTITPTRDGMNFVPTSQTIVLTGNRFDLNFISRRN